LSEEAPSLLPPQSVSAS